MMGRSSAVQDACPAIFRNLFFAGTRTARKPCTRGPMPVERIFRSVSGPLSMPSTTTMQQATAKPENMTLMPTLEKETQPAARSNLV